MLAAALAAIPFIASAAVHGMTAADLVSFARLSEPALSPDGKRVVYTLRETDLAADRGRTDLWLLELDGDAAPRRVTSNEENDSAPDWAADGSGVYFLSTRTGSAQVWYLPIAGGEATQVTRLPLEVAGFRASPRGNRLVVAIAVFPDCRDLECTKKRVEEKQAAKGHGQAYDQLFVRHWDKWEDGRVSKLFAVTLDAEHRTRGEPLPLTAALDADVPSKPFGGRSDYAFSPDGAQVVFSARVRGRNEATSTNFDIYRVPVDGSAAPVNLTADNPAWDAQPAYSPDGSLLAHLAMERAGFEADRFRLVVRDAGSGAIRFTTRDWDRSVAGFRFSADGREVYAVADDLGQHPLFSIDLGSGERRNLTGAGYVTEFEVAGKRIVYGLQNLSSPADLYQIDGSGPSRQVTSVNARGSRTSGSAHSSSSASRARAARRSTDTRSSPGISRPTGATRSRSSCTADRSRVAQYLELPLEPEVFAGAGYGVVFIDFHGSTGYGQAFTDSISGDWGGKPLEDLQKGLAAAAEKFPWLDRDRACALGGSYGGYMVNWIAGNWPDGFRCLVNHSGLFDHRSMYYTTEELWFPEWDHGGPTTTIPRPTRNPIPRTS
jgi:dipeptidyl aminopeptidase/acylaminoacyl peptidase